MLLIDEYLIKRVDKGDIIVRGNPLEISKKHYEDGWHVVGNLRDRDELEVEKTGILTSLAPGIEVRTKLPYVSFIDNDWYILEGLDLKY
jgi:hypothetical protein